MDIVFNFEKLIVYQKSKEFVKLVYTLLRKFPNDERYALCDQLRRASVSVPSNIAEGMSRQTTKDRMHYLDISYGSLMESFSQMDVAHDQQYITDADFQNIRTSVFEVYRLLAGLKKSIAKDQKANDKRLTAVEPKTKD